MRKLRQRLKELLRDTQPRVQGWDSNTDSIALQSRIALNHYAPLPVQGSRYPGKYKLKQGITCLNCQKYKRQTQSM